MEVEKLTKEEVKIKLAKLRGLQKTGFSRYLKVVRHLPPEKIKPYIQDVFVNSHNFILKLETQLMKLSISDLIQDVKKNIREGGFLGLVSKKSAEKALLQFISEFSHKICWGIEEKKIETAKELKKSLEDSIKGVETRFKHILESVQESQQNPKPKKRGRPRKKVDVSQDR